MTDNKNEAAHGLQASAAKQRIDEQVKPVPPSVGEFAVQQLAALKAQPSGVVLPERKGLHIHHDCLVPTYTKAWNACLDEVARLNSSPVSAGAVPPARTHRRPR